ncbi:hypothetical protein I203_101757 [Kwoniella mangroviensis CBS 8507]|uniref:uncharacterized protein n=1 Tax=Kwoniella mangroviensis CBS 8507 TaxID=1296122 RepID=UPI00080D59CF|nr:cytoplasmic protein [Kwoniella mangroviensis CBS 8507]OCF63626.1 cytoplasmic protein [Kwoniella mangroviensis CBS 8507]
MSWLVPSLPTWARATPASTSTANPPSNNEQEEEEEEEDIDAPPPFPLLNSHQRSSALAPAPSFSVAPPSPKKATNDDDEPPSDLNIAISDSPLGNMAPPPSTVKKPNFGIQKGGQDSSAGEEMAKKTQMKTKKRTKVALTPGHSALDWAKLTSSGEDLRGVQGFQRVTLAELKEHNTPDDAWSVFNGMVYNISPYLPFHPGGEDELMRVAGRDGTKLFMLTHSWVNLDFMLKECMVGVLVRG